MRILITGNMGYVGPVLVRHLRAVMPTVTLEGLDSGLFAHCLTGAREVPERLLDLQRFGDIRDIDGSALEGVDAVVHLSAVSNDPMGNRFEAVTARINFEATRRLAGLARDAGVSRFVFASSCSMYGFAEGGPRREKDLVNPLTAYARSKVASEEALERMADRDMMVTSLRFATACGMSDRLRLDLVLNDFVACAVASGRITVLSDGTPWRPLIDVKDMARAIEWALVRDGEPWIAVNTGADSWNHQVKGLAEAVASAVPGTAVDIDRKALPDRRSYRVDFSLFESLAPMHQPRVALEQSIGGLVSGLREMGFADVDFRSSQLVRLRVLLDHIARGRLDEDLRWRT